MDSNTATLIIGLAGIGGTLLSSALGFYFTAQARRSPMREFLYARQLDLVVRILRRAGLIRVLTVILVADDGEFKDQARADIGNAVKRLSELSNDAAALLPTELFAEVQQLTQLAADTLVKVDASEADRTLASKLDGQAAKTALMARTLLGVDELSDESMALFKAQGSLGRISKISAGNFRRRRSSG